MTEQVEAGATVHLPLQQLEAGDLQGYRIWSRTSFQRVVIGSGPAVQRWEGRLKGHIKLGHAYQEANLTRASSRER